MIRMASESGTTRWVSALEATETPATAPSTEMAGVMIPSPKNRAAPKIPNVTRVAARLARVRDKSAVRAMIPPSPRLWARMMKPAYLIETTTMSAQKISDAAPNTASGVTWEVAW